MNNLPPSLALGTAIFRPNVVAAIGFALWIDRHPFRLQRNKLPFRFRPWRTE